MGLLDAFKQYIRDASPGGLLNQEIPTGAPTEVAKGLLGFVPGIGDAISGYDAIHSARQGNYGEAALNAAGLLPFVPSLGGVIKASKTAGTAGDDAIRAQRMAEMGMEGGWYRGGTIPVNGKRTGPMYTQNPDEAAAYAKRFGDAADVREYAIPTNGFLNSGSSYSPKLAHDVARILDDPYYGKEGEYLAKQLRTYGPEERISGSAVWQSLESRFGNDGAAEVIQKLGPFVGAKGFTAPGEAYVFKNAPVRDANLAKFDPSRRNVDDIYGRATLPAMIGSGALGLLGLGAVRHIQDGEGKTPSRR